MSGGSSRRYPPELRERRLAVGVYATNASTPLFFAQAIGRYVRARRRGETSRQGSHGRPVRRRGRLRPYLRVRRLHRQVDGRRSHGVRGRRRAPPRGRRLRDQRLHAALLRPGDRPLRARPAPRRDTAAENSRGGSTISRMMFGSISMAPTCGRNPITRPTTSRIRGAATRTLGATNWHATMMSIPATAIRRVP